jgi:hypothetical protein
MSTLRPAAFVAAALSLAFVGASAVTALADPAKAPDPRIKAALQQLKYKFSVTERNNYQVEFTLKDKRSQTVFINTNTEKYGSLEIREVTSTAYKVKGALSAEEANKLLLDNDQRKWGGWRAVEDGGYTYVIYAVQLPANADAKTLDDAIDAVMYTADDKEKEVTKEDDF